MILITELEDSGINPAAPYEANMSQTQKPWRESAGVRVLAGEFILCDLSGEAQRQKR